MCRLMTTQLEEALKGYPLYSQDGKGKDAICRAIFVFGGVRWFILEGEKEGNDTILFGIVIALTGAINGYEHVKVTGGRLAIHENRKLEKEVRKVSIIEFDEIWFKGKNIVTFDDVITRGITWAAYSDQLENLGALFIAWSAKFCLLFAKFCLLFLKKK